MRTRRRKELLPPDIWPVRPEPDDVRGFLDLPIPALVASIAAGRVTAETVVRGYLARIERREGAIRAWAHLHDIGALADARRIQRSAPAPLMGIPLGVKDVIDTADMPTEYGSGAYMGFRPVADAACVALARQAGAIILGKTVTAEFALAAPGPTRNPVNESHTPGGSSSGSAAAVAAGMVPAALGSQTGGSLIRPAAYCGVVGYKPSFGFISRSGVKVLCESLDTLGVIARSVADAAFVTGILAQRDLPGRATTQNLRVGLYGVAKWGDLAQATRSALNQAANAFQSAGAQLVDISDFPEQEALLDAYERIALWEIAASLAFERTRHLSALQPLTREILSSPPPLAHEYEAALALAGATRSRMPAIFGGCDVLLAAAAPDEAPQGLLSTGDPVHCVSWSLLHAPCLTVPVTTGPRGLPVGVQLVGRIGDDGCLIMAGRMLERALALAETRPIEGNMPAAE